VSERVLEVLESGPACTVQDLGRSGHQAMGVPRSGALDSIALRLANALVGNDDTAAGLEFRMMGPRLRCTGGVSLVAVAGAVTGQMTPPQGTRSAPVQVEPWRSYRLEAGWTLSLKPRGACFGYVAVSGGVAVSPFLGSRATYQRGGFGGHEGRALAAGDRLPLGTATPSARPVQLRSLPEATEGPIRVIRGPQSEYFTAKAWETFLSTDYRVSREADRMGVRLEGETLEHVPALGADIVSDGMADGAIQVPGSGLPIVLLVDRQTVGGYPKIATVASADVRRFASLGPGDTIRFATISAQDAVSAIRAREKQVLDLIASMIEARPPGGIDVAALWTANIAGDAVNALQSDEGEGNR